MIVFPNDVGINSTILQNSFEKGKKKPKKPKKPKEPTKLKKPKKPTRLVGGNKPRDLVRPFELVNFIVNLSVGIPGILLNIVNFAVWTQPEMRKSPR